MKPDSFELDRSVLARDFPIDSRILTVRGTKVILDADLAVIYGVPTKRLNEQIKRNRKRFPEDFMFQLTATEKSEVVANCDHLARLKFSPMPPFAFTENGAVMAASVLNSTRAVRMSVFVVRSFVKMRHWLGGSQDLARQLQELEAKLTTRLDVHEAAIVEVLQRLMLLLDPALESEPPKPQIGFHACPEPRDTAANKLKRRFATRSKQKTLKDAQRVQTRISRITHT